jgi:Putative multicopper oxidases
VPDSTLINGKGRFEGGPHALLSVVNVQQGKRYRFRLISISCDTNYVFSIDGHNFTVIEADAQNTQPVVVDSIQIFAGMSPAHFELSCEPPVNHCHSPALFFRPQSR